MAWTQGKIADGLLPWEVVGSRISFEVIAAWEAQERRIRLFQELHQVMTQAICMTVPGGREQRNHAKPDGSSRIGTNHKAVGLRRRDTGGGGKCECVLLPFRLDSSNRRRPINNTSIITFERSRQ